MTKLFSCDRIRRKREKGDLPDEAIVHIRETSDNKCTRFASESGMRVLSRMERRDHRGETGSGDIGGFVSSSSAHSDANGRFSFAAVTQRANL